MHDCLPLKIDGELELKLNIKTEHVDTGAYLSAKKDVVYRNVIQGQLEVAGRSSAGRTEVWVAQEGIYFASA
jgi:hypothetical protein